MGTFKVVLGLLVIKIMYRPWTRNIIPMESENHSLLGFNLKSVNDHLEELLCSYAEELKEGEEVEYYYKLPEKAKAVEDVKDANEAEQAGEAKKQAAEPEKP